MERGREEKKKKEGGGRKGESEREIERDRETKMHRETDVRGCKRSMRGEREMAETGHVQGDGVWAEGAVRLHLLARLTKQLVY